MKTLAGLLDTNRDAVLDDKEASSIYEITGVETWGIDDGNEQVKKLFGKRAVLAVGNNEHVLIAKYSGSNINSYAERLRRLAYYIDAYNAIIITPEGIWHAKVNYVGRSTPHVDIRPIDGLDFSHAKVV